MDKVTILEQQLESKERELAEINQKLQDVSTYVENLNSRTASLSRLVENRHGVLDEANKAIAIAVERNHVLAGAMREALLALDDSCPALATEKLTAALETAPAPITDGHPFLDETRKMRDAALQAAELLNQALSPVR